MFQPLRAPLSTNIPDWGSEESEIVALNSFFQLANGESALDPKFQVILPSSLTFEFWALVLNLLLGFRFSIARRKMQTQVNKYYAWIGCTTVSSMTWNLDMIFWKKTVDMSVTEMTAKMAEYGLKPCALNDVKWVSLILLCGLKRANNICTTHFTTTVSCCLSPCQSSQWQ